MTRIALALALCALTVGCSSPAPAPDPRQGPLANRTATDLYQAYESNEVRADQTYKGLWLVVSGAVDDIGTDILSTPYITFDVGPNVVWGVQAMFTRNQDEALVASFSKGQQLELVCRVNGKLLNVLLEDCSRR